MKKMKIGDSVLVHGYVDEIRKDTVIIRNKGGYFGTVPSEIIKGDLIRCRDCKYATNTYYGECKYCDMWKDADGYVLELNVSEDFYCGFAERD